MKCEKCWGKGEKLDNLGLGMQAFLARRERGETMAQAARRMGISESMLCRLENGKRTWNEELFNRATKP